MTVVSPPRPQVSNIHGEEEPISSLLCKKIYSIFSLHQGVSLPRRLIVTLPVNIILCSSVCVCVLFSLHIFRA
jgi:hypothetical protein